MTGLTAETRPPRRLHLNESSFPPAAGVIKAIAEAAAGVNRYPAAEDAEFYRMLSLYAGVSEERLAVTSGSNELLHMLPLITQAQGAELVVPDPSFPTYTKVGEFHGINVIAVPVREDGCPDVDELLSAITPRTRLVCVPSPNNPTGGRLEEDEVKSLVRGVPETALLHFDEAYYEFGREDGAVEALPILQTRKGPWISSRSFSKAFSLAGLRLGYAIAGDTALARRIRVLKPNFCVNALAWAAGKATLADLALTENQVKETAAERQRLMEGLTALGFSPLCSSANFVSFPIPAFAENLHQRFEKAGFLVAPFLLPGDRPAIRITVGTAEDTKAVLAFLSSLREREEKEMQSENQGEQ